MPRTPEQRPQAMVPSCPFVDPQTGRIPRDCPKWDAPALGVYADAKLTGRDISKRPGLAKIEAMVTKCTPCTEEVAEITEMLRADDALPPFRG